MNLTARNVSIGTVIMDGFKIFGTDGKPGDVAVGLNFFGHIPDDVFHKFGVGESFFRNEFLIHPLQDGIYFAG